MTLYLMSPNKAKKSEEQYKAMMLDQSLGNVVDLIMNS